MHVFCFFFFWVGGSASESPNGPGQLILLVSLWSSYLLWGCNPSSYTSIRIPKLHPYLAVGVCICLESAAGSLRGQHAPVCKHNRVSFIVSGISACPWDGSQVGKVIGWPFPFPSPTSAFLVDRISIRSKVLWVGCCPYLCTRVPAWPQEAASPASISPVL